ncbi:hypothetical protein CPAR01_03800 [Colletotrichum paranaense]|uniref:Uncharacterized protein n=1 Tax=Colletotrichum paranaense TaxID=1914294 RepID=A0ABQ9SUI1_9PEZI|nr:uncharacterized protein CPAR01_03800 [Colletotrichum paranaense]KAK1543167.1 hypothetical protein CPAR01_03800 [Colletotrichum paranaense]
MPHILEPAGVGYYGYLGFLASVYGFPGLLVFKSCLSPPTSSRGFWMGY